MPIHGINDNLLLSCPSYSGVYQNKAKNRALPRYK